MTLGRRFTPVLLLGFLACTDKGTGDGEGGTTSGGSTGSESTGLPTTSGTSDSGGVDASSDEAGDDGPEGECLLWKLDECGEGRKCMPYSINPDRIPDAIQCCPSIDNPDLVGEPCEIMEYDGSCRDTCENGSMCVLDNPDTLTGLCRQFCDPASPACEPDHTCKAFFELLPGVPNVPLCMEQCDPVVQDCPQDNWHCIPDAPTEAGQSGFICVSPPPTPPKSLFAACGLANDCEKGLVCITADRVPDCPFTSCCSAFCDLGDADGPCEALHPEMNCVDWMSPDPGWQHVGVCALPG